MIPSRIAENPFWKCSRVLLDRPAMLAMALGGALLSAFSLGAGLGMTLPIFRLLLDRSRPLGEILADLAQRSGMPEGLKPAALRLAGGLPTDPLHAFTLLMVGMLLIGCIGGAGRYIHELAAASIILQSTRTWRSRLFGHLVRSPMPEIYRLGAIDGISRLMTDTQMLARGYEALLSRTLSEVLSGAVGLFIALILDWRLTGIAIIGIPLIAVLLRGFRVAIKGASRRALGQYSRMLAVAQASLMHLSVIKTHTAESEIERRFEAINTSVLAEEMSVCRVKSLASPAIEGAILAGSCAISCAAAWFIFRRNVQPSSLLTLLLALSAAAAALKPMAKLSERIGEAEAAAARLLEVLQRGAERSPAASPPSIPLAPRHAQALVFDQISYAYPGARRPAVDQVSFSVRHGQLVALVGPNGSGKSTLLNLLPRLMEPEEGRILLDGRDIAELDLHSLRRQIAVVPQETVLFQESIADNIRFGCPQADADAVRAAARAAMAHEFIERLPEGYNTRLGEMGAGLSVGQKQRIAIARAVLRDPAILILDEPTSQLDSDSEAVINRVLRSFRGKLTQIIIAHRLPTVMDADLILVLDSGRLASAGRHDELYKSCDIYRSLFQAHQILPSIPEAARVVGIS